MHKPLAVEDADLERVHALVVFAEVVHEVHDGLWDCAGTFLQWGHVGARFVAGNSRALDSSASPTIGITGRDSARISTYVQYGASGGKNLAHAKR